MVARVRGQPGNLLTTVDFICLPTGPVHWVAAGGAFVGVACVVAWHSGLRVVADDVQTKEATRMGGNAESILGRKSVA